MLVKIKRDPRGLKNSHATRVTKECVGISLLTEVY